MKLATLLIINLIAYEIAFSQTKIEGLGHFKIKKTTVASLDSLELQGFKKLKPGTRKEYFDRSQKLTFEEILIDSSKTYQHYRSHVCKNTRVFSIPEMKISSITIEGLFLTFYNDTLAVINLEWSPQVTEALESKYGAGEISRKDDEVNCVIKLTGQNVKHTSSMFYTKWNNNDISCVSAIGNYYDSSCQEQSISYISISNIMVELKIRGCDKIEEDRLKEIKKKQQAKQYKDF